MKKIFFFVRHCFNDTKSSFADKCSGPFLSVRPAARARARRRYVRARDCRGIPMAKCETKQKKGFLLRLPSDLVLESVGGKKRCNVLPAARASQSDWYRT